jgi:hypothetical protein
MKVMCKKGLNTKEFIEGKYYEMFMEVADSYWIMSEDSISLRNFKKDKEQYRFEVLLFSDHFYTNKELRKEKLNKLKNIS